MKSPTDALGKVSVIAENSCTIPFDFSQSRGIAPKFEPVKPSHPCRKFCYRKAYSGSMNPNLILTIS
jgi:hypothetical protein